MLPRNGPRLFVGKLPKGTNQQDLRNHFSKFGFVMDVFIPRAKNNKKEHRGFGFVTYETEAAIQVQPLYSQCSIEYLQGGQMHLNKIIHVFLEGGGTWNS